MATIASRITSTGTLFTSGEINEVTASTIRVNTTTQYAALFDEVTQSPIKNLLTYTEQFDNTSGWSTATGQVVVSADVISSPINTTTADLLLNSAPTGRHTMNSSVISVTERVATYTWSVHVKAYSTLTYLTLYFATGYQQPDRIGINVNPSTGVINTTGTAGSGTYITSTSEPKTNGWYRVSVTGNITNTALSGAGTLTGSIGISTTTAQASLVNPGYIGDGTTGFYVWGAQFEAGYLTPYQGIGASGVIVTPDFAERKTSTGTYIVSGSFDEVTGMIVTNGLLAYYDAGKVASQPATGATWYDISDRRNNATPSASPPTFNSAGYFTLDAVNAQRYLTTALNPTTWAEPWTIEVWMYTPTGAVWGNGVNRSHHISKGSTAGTWGIVRYPTDNQVSTWVRGAAEQAETARATLARDRWHQFVGTWNGVNTVSSYLNGAFVGSATVTPTGAPDTGSLLIGGANNQTVSGSPGTYYEGNIAAVMLYNRALSLAEVNNNFQALRDRFGI